MRRRDTALAVLVALLWGTNFVAIRTGLDSVPPLLFLAVRFTVVCLPAVFLVRRPALPWRDLALIGLFTSLGQFALLYLSLHLGMPPGLSSLVLQAQVLLTVVIAAVWLRERPSLLQRVGVPLGGLVLAAMSWGIGNVLTRRAGALTGRGAGLGLTVWSGLVVPLPALALSFVFEGPAAIGAALGHLQWQALASTAYTAYLSSLVGYGIWNTLLGRYPVAKVTPFAMLVPVFGMAADAIVFGERPHALELAGGSVLLAGVAVAVTRRPAGAGAVVTTTAPAPEQAGPPVPRDASPLLAVEIEPPVGSAGEATDLVQLAP